MPPQNIYALFDRNVPVSLVECIADLLKYDPDLRLTSEECLHHKYLQETGPLNDPPGPPVSPPQTVPLKLTTSISHSSQYSDGVSPSPSLRSVAPRSIPPSHSHPGGHPKLHPIPVRAFPDASSSHRSSFYDSGYHSVTRQRSMSELSQPASEYSGDIIYSPRTSEAEQAEARRAALAQSPEAACSSSVYSHGADRVANVDGWVAEEQARRDWDAMDVSPQSEVPQDASYATAHHPMDVQTSPIVPEYPARPAHEPELSAASANSHGQGNKFPKFASLGFGKKHARWGLGMFSHNEKQNALPSVQENGVASTSSTPSLKRRESSSTDSRSLPEISPGSEFLRHPLPPANSEEAKQRKKEQERMAKEVQKEAERQKRIRAEKMQREQARAVMKNNRRLAQAVPDKYSTSIQWLGGAHGNGLARQPSSTGPIRQPQNYGSSLTVNAAGGSFKSSAPSPVVASPQDTDMNRAERRRDYERMPKARRREYDDDHSMSSDVRSSMSVISFATVDSDPGPGRERDRARHRQQGAFGMNRMTSMNSIRGSSSIEDFAASPGRSSTSLSQEQQLVNDFHLRASVDSSSISDHGSPQSPPMHMLSLSSPIPWQHSHSDLSSSSTVDNSGLRSPHLLSSPLSPPPQPRQPGPLHLGPQSPYGPPSPGSAINPMFKVVSSNLTGASMKIG